MLVFKPAYDMDSIAREVKKELCDKITGRLSSLAIRELQQEKLAEAHNSSKETIDAINTSESDCAKRPDSQSAKGA